MTAMPVLRERLVLERLKETYEQRGYEFFIQPVPDMLPSFLKGHRPDAIALKQGEGVIIEVKFGERADRDERLKSLAALLEGRQDWQLRVYFEQPRPDDILSIQPPSRTEIDRRIEEVEALARTGHETAAFLLGWSVLEAIARSRAVEQGLSVSRPISPESTVQTLEMGGIIDDRTGRTLRDKARLRTLVAHGDLSTKVTRDTVESLIRQLRTLAAEGATPRAPRHEHAAP